MKIKEVSIENFRSYSDSTLVSIDPSISIFVGPNGGGKTNTLDAIQLVLRQFILRGYDLVPSDPQLPEIRGFQVRQFHVPSLFTKHSGREQQDQTFVFKMEFDIHDKRKITSIAECVGHLEDSIKRTYLNIDFDAPNRWMQLPEAAHEARFEIRNGTLQHPQSAVDNLILQYLSDIEKFNIVLAERQVGDFSHSLLYFPVSRASQPSNFKVQLAGYNESQSKAMIENTSSKSNVPIVNYAVSKLARKHRIAENKGGDISAKFAEDSVCVRLTKALASIGYGWRLECVNINNNEYVVKITKNELEFDAQFSSSGEQEIFSYIFGIFVLDIKGAVIIIDEPELHLHPRWQSSVLKLFRDLAAETSNQFILSTHSATFIVPEAVKNVCRVYIRNGATSVIPIDKAWNVDARHLVSIINSYNNERVFFSDFVVLVEGISDRIFFERIIASIYPKTRVEKNIEIVSVGGKGLFSLYQGLLKAIGVNVFIIADFDYLAQVGSPDAKSALSVNKISVVHDILLNGKSLDGEQFYDYLQKAIKDGNLADLENCFRFISSRRLKNTVINREGATYILNCIRNLRKEDIFILKRGSLESYTPAKHVRKDINKLISILEDSAFPSNLPARPFFELKKIFELIVK